MPGTPWTAAEDERLKELTAEARWSTREIAAAMDKSKNSIIGRQHRLSLRGPAPPGKGPAWTDEQTAQLRVLVAKGLSDSAIGEATGRTVLSIRNRRLRLCIGAPPQRPVQRRPKGRALPRKSRRAPAAVAASLKISLLDLEHHHCRFMCDEKDADGLAVYCGRPAVDGTSWCPGHYQFVFRNRQSFLQAAE